MTKTLIEVSKKLHNNNLSLVTAESCTGGLIAKQITDLSGSSAIFDRGFITYSNQAKQDMLGVSKQLLDTYGAVSEQVVIQMVEGALKNSQADISCSVSGIAGPTGGSIEKPVGTVCFGWMQRDKAAIAETVLLSGDRDEIRKKAAEHTLKGIIKLIK